MDSSRSDLLSSVCRALSAKLAPVNSTSGQLTIGKQGVYLIDRSQKVTEFRLVRWEQVLADLRSPGV